MNQLTRRGLAVLTCALSSAIVGCAASGGHPPQFAPDRPTVVIVVRHAEKSAPSGDVALSALGEARAVALSDALAGTRVDGVITTTLLRTRQTAAPLVRARQLTPIEVPPASDVAAHAAQIASLVRSRFAGRAVLIVGHSNTVPAIVRALGGPAMPDLCDTEYAGMFVVVLAAGDSARVIRSSYGLPDPAEKTGCPTMR